jgi:hypothetical protein
MKSSALLLLTSVYLGVCTVLGAAIDMPWQIVGTTCFGCVILMIAAMHELIFNNN